MHEAQGEVAVSAGCGGGDRSKASRRALADHRPEDLEGFCELRGDFVAEVAGEPFESEGAMEATPGGSPFLKLPAVAQCGHELGSPGSEACGPEVVRLGRAFEVKPELDAAAAGHRLKLEVDVGVSVVELEDGPHDAALGRVLGSWERLHGEVFGEEEELAGLESAVFGGHVCSVGRSLGTVEGGPALDYGQPRQWLLIG